MYGSLNVLVSEHRIIESAMNRIEAECQAMTQDFPAGARLMVGQWVHFIRTFADKLHHGKEENILFAEMCNHGFSRESGPIAVMLSDHDEGRSLTAQLAEIAQGEGPPSEAEYYSLFAAAQGYCQLLRAHIQKEDNILYRMALQRLDESVLTRVALAFAEIDRSFSVELRQSLVAWASGGAGDA
jgi:hemerythrin-like domain-containing protein